MHDQGCYPLTVVITSKAQDIGDGCVEAETISSSVALSLSTSPETLADLLNELAYFLYRRPLRERLLYREALKAHLPPRGREALEYLYDPEEAARDTLYEAMKEVGTDSFVQFMQWARDGKIGGSPEVGG